MVTSYIFARRGDNNNFLTPYKLTENLIYTAARVLSDTANAEDKKQTNPARTQRLVKPLDNAQTWRLVINNLKVNAGQNVTG